GAGRPHPDRLAFDAVEQRPPVQRRRIGLEAAGPLPDGDRLGLYDETPLKTWPPELPHGIEAPAEVFQRVAQVGHLPVEHAVDLACRIEEEVAGPVVAVDDREFLRGRWWVGLQPADRGPGDRQRLGLVLV